MLVLGSYIPQTGVDSCDCMQELSLIVNVQVFKPLDPRGQLLRSPRARLSTFSCRGGKSKMFWNDNPGRYVLAGRLGALGGSLAAGAKGVYDMGRAFKKARKRLRANFGSPARRPYHNSPTRGLRPRHQTMSRFTGRVSSYGRPHSERYLRRYKARRYRPRKVTRRKRRYYRKYKK